MNKKIWNTSGVKVSEEISSFLAKNEDISSDTFTPEVFHIFLFIINSC